MQKETLGVLTSDTPHRGPHTTPTTCGRGTEILATFLSLQTIKLLENNGSSVCTVCPLYLTYHLLSVLYHLSSIIYYISAIYLPTCLSPHHLSHMGL